MNNTIQHFENFDLNTYIRVIEIEGQPWFVAKDVCKGLQIKNSRAAVSGLDNYERTTFTNSNIDEVDLKLPNRGLQFVNESGLYSLIFRSRKPKAKRFKRWVTSEVLPEIRKTGSYGQTSLPHYFNPSRLEYLTTEEFLLYKNVRPCGQLEWYLEKPTKRFARLNGRKPITLPTDHFQVTKKAYHVSDLEDGLGFISKDNEHFRYLFTKPSAVLSDSPNHNFKLLPQ